MHRIVHAQAKPDFSINLRFEDGKEARVDLTEFVASAEITAAFRDPARFVAALIIVEDGEILRWDDQFELHADSLRYHAFPDELRQDYGTGATRRGRPAA